MSVLVSAVRKLNMLVCTGGSMLFLLALVMDEQPVHHCSTICPRDPD